MTVQSVMILAAELLGRQELKEAVLSGTASEEAKALLRCYNLVENEVALDYFPLKKTEHLTGENGKIPYTAFSEFPVDVLRATADGISMRFEIFPEYLKLHSGNSADVTYSYAPAEKSVGEDTAFGDKISARLLAAGVCSEYLLTERRYEESKMWGLRYYDALRAAGILRRTLSVRARRWV